MYISSRGASMAPEGMDKKYLVNALVLSSKIRGSKQAAANVEVLKAEIIRRLTKAK